MEKNNISRIVYNIFIVLLLVAGAVFVVCQFVHFGDVEFTDNARVRQHIVPQNTRVQGFIRGFLQRVQSCAVECLEQGVVVAVGQLHQVDYPAYRAHVVEVVHARLVRFWVLLHEGGYQGAFLVGQFQCLQALLPAYGDGGHRAGKEYVVAQCQYAHVAVVALAYYLFYVGIYFCNE